MNTIKDFTKKHEKDKAFSSLTHGLSTYATIACLAAFIPAVFNALYNRESLTIPTILDDNAEISILFFFICLFCTVGSCMIPDLDNSNSRAESSLGFVGGIASGLFRSIARTIQTAFKMPRDDKEPDPHRGFWHTPMGAVALAAPVYFIGSGATGEYDNFGTIFLIATVYVLTYLAFMCLMHNFIKKAPKDKRSLYRLLPYVFSFLVVAAMIVVDNGDLFAYSWPVAFSVFMGMMLHIFGDCHTKSGAPIFSPITAITRKKVWWTTRFFKLESGGEFERDVLVKLYLAASIIGTIAFFNAQM